MNQLTKPRIIKKKIMKYSASEGTNYKSGLQELQSCDQEGCLMT
jgi:hypothetical protein